MEYRVIGDDNLESVIEQVNEALEEGWKLQGGISIAVSRVQGYLTEFYAQAMIKGVK